MPIVPSSKYLATDAEWDSSRGVDICVQFNFQNGDSGIYLNSGIARYLDTPTFYKVKDRSIAWGEFTGTIVKWVDFDDDRSLVNEFCEAVGVNRKNVNLRIFASPKDISLAFGFNNVKELYLKADKEKNTSAITQKRNIKAVRVAIAGKTVSIHDLKGWVAGSLKKLADSVNYKMTAKGDMDEYKTHMLDGLVEEPEKFLDYALGDVVDLHGIHDSFVEYVKVRVCRDILGVELTGELPHTTGSVVAGTFQQWLETLPQDKLALKFACSKLGILDPSKDNYEQSRETLNRLVKRFRNADEIADLPDRDGITKTVESLQRNMRALAYSQASVRELALDSTTVAFSALVQGGRCNNEYPHAYKIGVGGDIDLKSCYGSALVAFIYPMGLPTVWGQTENQLPQTLGQWLKKYQNDLVPGLWTATISGDISFAQDVLFSKLTTLTAIQRAAHADDYDKDVDDTERSDVAHLPGDFVLLRRQIQNGIITQDIWNALDKIMTNAERKEILNLHLVSAVAYLKSDQVEDVDTWVDEVIKSPGTMRASTTHAKNISDKRTRKWAAIPIKNFIQPLVEKRNEVKGLKKNDPSMAALDEALKLFINTLYGVLASPYFPIGNTVVANSITARARLGAWMMNKALRTAQSITDGGMYELMSVAFLDKSDRLPGLDVLSKRDEWLDRRRSNRKLGTLGGVDWTTRIYPDLPLSEAKTIAKDLDTLALTHINEFWGNYGLSLPFDIEHKEENTFVKAAYWNKAHYAFELACPEANKGDTRKYKIRGAKEYKNSELHQSPMYRLLDNILDGSDEFPVELSYDHFYLLKIAKWAEVQKSRGYEGLKDKRPGDEVIEARLARFNNTHFPIDTEKDFKLRSRRRTEESRKGVKHNLQFFERFASKGIAWVHQQMTENNLR